MSTQIFYFSGTGNSLYIAKELEKRFPDTILVPMISVLNKDKIYTTAESIGFVFPIHAFTMPAPVKQFLERLDTTSSKYIFAVATRGGSPCRVFPQIDKILNKNGKALNAQFYVNMPNNYLPTFQMATKEEIIKLEAETNKTLEYMETVILNTQESKEKDPHGSFLEENILFPILTQVFHKTGYFNTEKNFYADENCTGCGICSQVCLSRKIKMQQDKPQWDKCVSCIFCFACIHYCPAKAIQIKKTKTHLKGRYHHKAVTMMDIASQKI